MPYCRIHLEKELQSVCLEKTCEKKGMICALCARENHMGHVIIPTQEIQSFISNDSQIRITEKTLITEINQIQEAISQLQVKMNKVQAALSEKVDEIQQSLDSILNTNTVSLQSSIKETQCLLSQLVYGQSNSDIYLGQLLAYNPDVFELDQQFILRKFNLLALKEIHEEIKYSSENIYGCIDDIERTFEEIDKHVGSIIIPASNGSCNNNSNSKLHGNVMTQGMSNQGIIEQFTKSGLAMERRLLDSQWENNYNGLTITANGNGGNRTPKGNEIEQGIVSHQIVAQKEEVKANNMNILDKNNQKNNLKIKIQPGTYSELEQELNELSQISNIRNLWIQFPLGMQVGIQRFCEVVAEKKTLKRLFVTFQRKQEILASGLEQLFNAVSGLTSLQIFALKVNDCVISQDFNWEIMIKVFSHLLKKSLIKCLVYLNPGDKQIVQKIIRSCKNTLQLQELIDFSQ